MEFICSSPCHYHHCDFYIRLAVYTTLIRFHLSSVHSCVLFISSHIRGGPFNFWGGEGDLQARTLVKKKQNSSTRPLPKKNSRKTLPDGLTHATSEKNINHMHTCPEKKLISREGFEKKFAPIPNYPPLPPQKLNGPDPLRAELC